VGQRKIVISGAALAEFMDLPDGVQILGVTDHTLSNLYRDQFAFVLDIPGLPDVDGEPPEIKGAYDLLAAPYGRWSWNEP